MTRRTIRPVGAALQGLHEHRLVVLIADRPRPRPRPARRAAWPGHPLRWAAVLVGCLVMGGGC